MSRILVWVVAGGAIAAGASVGSAGAMPTVPLVGAETAPLVQKVHGGHNWCDWGRGWFHRHVGLYDRALGCTRVYGERYYGGPSVILRFGDRDRDRDRRFRRGDRDGDRRGEGRRGKD